MQSTIKELFYTISRNSNILGITADDVEAFYQKDSFMHAADVQSGHNGSEVFQSLCTEIRDKLKEAIGKQQYATHMMLYVEMPEGEQGLTMQDMELLNQTRNQIAPDAQFILAIGTHHDASLRLAAVISVPLQMQ
ncbi:MAG: hypothetical protein PUG74_11955 [Prevotellaceae bacterium]|nr:hypothetical protein [Prevotellaceae bacterium]